MDIAVTHNNAPAVSVYPWLPGFGTKYTDPGIAIFGTSSGVSFASGGTDIAISLNNPPRIHAYPWTTGVGFGVKYADPSIAVAGPGQRVHFNPAGNDIAVTNAAFNPFMRAYPRTSGVGFGVAYTNPASIPAIGFGIAFSNDGNSVAMTGNGSSIARPFTSGVGFGIPYTNPVGVPAQGGVFFSANSDAVSFGGGGTLGLRVWDWLPGWGTGYPWGNIGQGNDTHFSPTSNDVAYARNANQGYVSVRPFTPGVGYGVQYAAPSILPTGNCLGVRFSSDGNNIAFAHNNAPFVSAYPWTTGVGFGIKYTDPGIALAGNGTKLDFTPLPSGPSVIPNFFMFMT